MDQKKTEQQRRQQFAEQIRRVLGPQLSTLSARQTELLNQSLKRTFEEGRPVSDEELLGKLELITEFVSPAKHEKVQEAFHSSLRGSF